MRILNMLTAGGIGGIEVLCRAIGKYSEDENIFCFLFDQGIIYEQMKEMVKAMDEISFTSNEIGRIITTKKRFLLGK